MTPGPSFTMPAISRSASADPLPRAATATTNDNAAEPRPSQADQASASTHHLASVADEHVAHDRTNAAAQPKHCARCGQLLDLAPASNDTAHPHASSSSSIPAPSPSSYAFAPDSVRSHHRIQPHQSLTSAINAAAAVALSRHLGTNDDILVTDSDGHAICTHCSAQLADSSHDPSRSTIVAASSHEQPASSASLSVAPAPTRHTDTQHAPDAQIADTASEAPIASTSADTNGPQMRLTISVNNMGAGGDAPRSHSIDDVTMHDPSAFPPLERAPASPALRAPSSPPPVARSTSRTRIRFADASTHRHPADANGAAPATHTDALARSGSFSRSLSYNGPGFDHESVSASSAQVVVSFPPANASALAPDSTPTLNAQAALSFAPSLTPSAAAMAPSTPQQSRSRSSSHLQASGNTHAAAPHAHVPAPANAIPGGAKQRRPSSARRLSRSGSSTGPTTLPFAAVGADPALAKDDDPYGPSAMTRPRLSLIPRHVIADTLYYSAHAQRPASLGTTSTSTSLSMPSAALAHTFDPTRAVKYHADPLALRDPKPEAATGARGTDEEKQALGVAAKWGDVRWFDPYKPDPLAELSRLRTPPKGRGCLYPGATFNGTQKSGRNSYDVTVRIVNVDLEASHLCGYLNIRGLTEDWPELTTYFDAEIIGDRYGFVTGKWGATEADDLKHWARFPPFRPLRSALSKPGLRFHHANKPFVFMRWKEKFLVPDHRVRDINGASFAGFYYVCVELGESAAPPGRAEAEARQRSNSNVSMTSASAYGEDQSMYDGEWVRNERSGRGTLVLANGDRYEGHWLNDKKEGPGRYFYKATRKMYEGEWVDGAPKCGTYHDDTEFNMHDDDLEDDASHNFFQMPELELAHPDQVLSEGVAGIRQDRVRERAFQIDEDNLDTDAAPHRSSVTATELEPGVIVFDEQMLRAIQSEFAALLAVQSAELAESPDKISAKTRSGCIPCSRLPGLIDVLQLDVSEDQLVDLLQEIGATNDTLVSFAECVDILSLLMESQEAIIEEEDEDNDSEY